MRLFLDTEFTSLTTHAQLISLALVALDCSYFYAEFTDYEASQLTDWHRTHVIAHLVLPEQADRLPRNGTTVYGNKTTVVTALKEWLSGWPEVEIWADVPAYDWVLFCELFGGALHIPEHIHYIVRDLATLLQARSLDPDTDRFALAFGEHGPPGGLPRHNALADAWGGMEILTTLDI